ncbi:hypothetical protein KIN20_001437 [Parelaphostrongylus tenuis]|uniref:Uncharacterized protein n=1 Tax=Parelaphostrongylus tenuis TaxID=148309 RepID=A0AAD5MF85_PARTN|nr:hypothetical protein KIN20_001437 [Parelaphostrongylus tenuis]
MLASVFILFIILVLGKSEEEVPRASGIRSIGSAEIRRAPVYKVQNSVPRAHGFKRTSTGVRRSPTYVRASPSKKQPKPMRAPLSMPSITPLPMQPMPFPVVTFPPMVSFPTFPTLTTIAMPTLPGLTMPPSFQRLMGITTSSPVRTHNKRLDRIEYERPRSEIINRIERERPGRPIKNMYEIKESNTPKRLSPVSSRLPKFVNSQDVVVVTPEENADWIVPF